MIDSCNIRAIIDNILTCMMCSGRAMFVARKIGAFFWDNDNKGDVFRACAQCLVKANLLDEDDYDNLDFGFSKEQRQISKTLNKQETSAQLNTDGQ